MMKIYAPASDGNTPKKYAQDVADYLGVGIDTPIAYLDVDKWASIIAKVESKQGYKKLKTLGLIK